MNRKRKELQGISGTVWTLVTGRKAERTAAFYVGIKPPTSLLSFLFLASSLSFFYKVNMACSTRFIGFMASNSNKVY